MHYRGKHSKRLKFITVIAILGAAALMVALTAGIIAWNQDNREVITEPALYESVLGPEGEYKHNYFVHNDIFPDRLPPSAAVEDFRYEYYNPWDANYLGYLTYTCNAADYQAEYARLAALPSSENYFIYGITDFPRTLCAVYADSYHGIIYALTEPAARRFIYVELEFCNYFCDIPYQQLIPAPYLPHGFDAAKNNPTRQAMEQTFL